MLTEATVTLGRALQNTSITSRGKENIFKALDI